MRNLLRQMKAKFWYLVSYHYFVKKGFHPTQASVIAKNIAILKTEKKQGGHHVNGRGTGNRNI